MRNQIGPDRDPAPPPVTEDFAAAIIVPYEPPSAVESTDADVADDALNGNDPLGMNPLGLDDVLEDEDEVEESFERWMQGGVRGDRAGRDGAGPRGGGGSVRGSDGSRSEMARVRGDVAPHRPATASVAAREDYFASATAALTWPGEELDPYDATHDEEEEEVREDGDRSGGADRWHPPHANHSRALFVPAGGGGAGGRPGSWADPAEEPGAGAVAVAAAGAVVAAPYHPRLPQTQTRGAQHQHHLLRPRTAPPVRPPLLRANNLGSGWPEDPGSVQVNGQGKGKGVAVPTSTEGGGEGFHPSFGDWNCVGSGRGAGPGPLAQIEQLPDEVLRMVLSRLSWRSLAAVEASSPELRRVIVEHRVWADAIAAAALCAGDAIAGGLVSDTAGPQSTTLQLHNSALLKRLARRLSRQPHSTAPLGPNLAAEALCASSTDNVEEKVEHVLVPRVRGGTHKRPSYWSSAGSTSPNAVDYIVLRLAVPIAVVHAVYLRPFRAYFQPRKPIYAPLRVRFHVSMAPTGHRHQYRHRAGAGYGGYGGGNGGFTPGGFSDPPGGAGINHCQSGTGSGRNGGGFGSYLWTSPEYRVQPRDELQRFELPHAVLCVGGMVQVELLGRCRSQESDGMYYVALSHVRIEGSPLPGYIPALVDDAEPSCAGGGSLGSRSAGSGGRSGGSVGKGVSRTGSSGCRPRDANGGVAGGSGGPRRSISSSGGQKLMLRVVRPAVFNALSRVYSGGVGVGGSGVRPRSATSAARRAVVAGMGVGGRGHPVEDESEGSDESWNSDIDWD